jgi:hypothetical protein
MIRRTFLYSVRVAFAGLYAFSGFVFCGALVQHHIQRGWAPPILAEALINIVMTVIALAFAIAAWVLFRERTSMSRTYMRWPFLASLQFFLLFTGLTVFYLFRKSGLDSLLYLQELFGVFQLIGLFGMLMFRPERRGTPPKS